jgi:signal transduction histidine kinase
MLEQYSSILLAPIPGRTLPVNSVLACERLAARAAQNPDLANHPAILRWNKILRPELDHSLNASEHLREWQLALASAPDSGRSRFLSYPDLVTLSLSEGKYTAVALMERTAFDQWLLAKLPLREQDQKEGVVEILQGEQVLVLTGQTGQMTMHRETSIEGGRLPFNLLRTWRLPRATLEREARIQALMSGAMVALSLLLMAMAGIAAWRTLRRERRLLDLKGNFLSAVTHELKTPLTSIRMFADTLASGRVKDPAKVLHYGNLVRNEAVRLESLIEDILSFSRLEREGERLVKESLDFGALALETAERYRTIAEAKQVELVLPERMEALVLGDRRSLESLVGNLVDNAIKYTPSGGTVQVRLSAGEGGPVLSVSDTGVGIPLAEQSRVFEVFYRVGDEMTRSTKGSGLGLAIVRRAAEQHDAHVSLHSTPGKGTVFTVTFREKNG